MRPTQNNRNLDNQNVVQKFNKKSIYTIGFTYNTSAGGTMEQQPNLGGRARFLHGIVITIPAANVNDVEEISLQINSEQVIKTAPVQAYLPNVNIFKEAQFYFLGKILTGADTADLLVKATNAHSFGITFYLSDTV